VADASLVASVSAPRVEALVVYAAGEVKRRFHYRSLQSHWVHQQRLYVYGAVALPD
jgi:hypothetical protein